jgi:hypothetical protein
MDIGISTNLMLDQTAGNPEVRVSEVRNNALAAGTCCRMCDYCPGFVSTDLSSGFYTCYHCKHHKDHHFC